MHTVNIPQTPEEWDAWTADVKRSLESGREAILALMGHRSYEDYLASYLWRKIKKRVTAKYDGKCFRCGGRASEVHHRSYTEPVLSGHDDDQLRPLCGGCHHVVEFGDAGWRRSEADKERVLFERDIPLNYPRPILHKNGKKVLNPPNVQRMNSRQRQAWLKELHFLYFTRGTPDLEQKNPAAYARLKERCDATKGYGIELPSHRRLGAAARSRRKFSALPP